MPRANDYQKIKNALENGYDRKIGKRAHVSQTLTYVISDKKFFHHANIYSANAEKAFLEFALGREMRMYKVWNVKSDSAVADMKFLRYTLNNCANWNDNQIVMDRVLRSAGY